MESLDPPSNIANVGKSMRRISSILKAPRTSVDFADPELVGTPVQVAIPVEKRNSKRVSFAPAIDVLLFSKNGSPVRSTLQDLTAANNADNRNPIGVIEKGKQPIADMENLLYAPLQTSQRRKEVSMVSHDAEDLYGEKTMTFGDHDADMDLTHSQTVWITNDSTLPDPDGEMLPTCANMDFFMSMDKKKAESCILPKLTSTSERHFDPEFEKLLASFSKPTVAKDNFMPHKVDQNALSRPHDKENQAPSFTATRREHMPHNLKFGESSNRGVPSEDTQGMEMTDVLTGTIVENATADNPLQCLFPTLDLYRHSEHSLFSITAPYKNSEDFELDMDLTRCQTGVIEAKDLDLGKPSYTVNAGGSVRIIADNQQDRALSQVKMATDNFEIDNMEMTQSQTAAIVSLHGVESLQMSQDIVKSSEKWNDSLDNDDMEFTTCGTRVFETVDVDVPAIRASTSFRSAFTKAFTQKTLQNEFGGAMLESLHSNTLLHSEDTMDGLTSRRKGFERYNCESEDMEMTKSQTVAIDAKNLNAVKTFGNNRRKSLAFADTYAKVDVAEDGYCGDKIQTNTETDSEMEFTKSQTRPIETNHLTFVKPSQIFPEANQENDRHTLCSEDMELTKSQTVALNYKSSGISNILFHSGRKSLALLKEKSPGMHVNVINMSSSDSHNPDEMDITRSHTVAMQSKDVYRPDDASLNNFQVTGPPEGLSPNHSGSAEELGVHLKNRAHGLTAFGGMDLAQNGTIPIKLNQKAITLSKSMFSLDGKVSDLTDQLDSSQKEVRSLSVDKNSPGNANAFEASSETVATQNKNGSDLRLENCSLSCSGLGSTPCIEAEVDRVDEASSTKSRRMSLVDLQFKLRRMSRLPYEPTEKFTPDVCDVLLSQPKSASGGISDKTHLTAQQHYPETQMTDNADDTQPEQLAEEQRPSVTGPLNLNRRSLTSRLSMGNLLPKLPPKIKPADRNKASSSCRTPGREHENKVDTHQLSSSMSDNIVDEVLPNISSDEDLSMVTENPQSTNEDDSPPHGRHVQSTSKEVVWELSPGNTSDSQCKRPSPVDGEDMMATEKRRRIFSDSTIEMPNQSPEEGTCIDKLPLTPAVTNKAIDVSNRSTSQLRSETTFESTLKQSLFESQLEVNMDYTNEFQKNIADERITLSEFFQLLNIDFVIHNPRQSILPGKLASHLGHTPEDLLKNRHINHPKQMVYEADLKNLAEKVERLKARMKDQARLLHTVNQPLWEELKCFSEDELKRFGSKMKERSNFFRKRSKAQSHEMKEALYSNLLQANLEERQKLRGKMEEADGMLKSLDDCIQELETELAVEENGSDDGKLTFKSSQLGLENVTMELADKERQICEMEVQKKCNMDQVKRLQTEIQDLNGHITLLHRVNEWKVAERRADCEVYSFLYGSMHLEVVFDTGAGKGPDEVNERNILDINFKLELDEEKSECHACLVHTLLSEFTTGRSDWLEKYPSSRCVPKLLHDVALVVSRCRLLGEEVRLLKTWGSLKFDILDIRCVDTRVHIVFSSLEAMAEFELSLAVTMAYPCCPLQVQDFKNHIGSTTVRCLEEIVSSVSPGKNYLTKIVKAIHTAVHS